MESKDRISCMIVDDDPVSLRLIQSMVEKVDYLRLTGTFNNPLDALEATFEEEPDLIFLDIEMPEMGGMDLIRSLQYKPEIILISVKNNYALDAFEHDVADYLVKPVTEHHRFLRAANKAKRNVEAKRTRVDKNPNVLFMKVDSLLLNIKLEEIYWVKAYGDFVKVHTKNRVYTVLSKFQSIIDRLPENDFARVHRSFLVRIDCVENIDQSNLQIGNKIIPISRSYKKLLIEKINIL